MDANHLSQENSDGFWSLANIVLGFAFGLFALVSGGSLFLKAVFNGKDAPAPAASASAVPAPAVAPAAPTPAAAPAPTANKSSGNDITIRTDKANPLAYDTKGFTVKSGQKVRITFENDASVPLQHNLIICKPGTKDKVMALAGAMAADPQGLAKGYIPDSPDILAHTKLLNQKETQTLELDTLAPGEYGYFCSFLGHSLIMNGVMKVE